MLEERGVHMFARELSQFVNLGETVTITALKQRTGQRALFRIDGDMASPTGACYAKLLRRADGDLMANSG
jgi:hypothetical protein